MNTSIQNKPSLFTAIALMTLVNGIFNVIFGVALILGTFGIALLCFPIPLFPLILGGFEIAYAMKLLADPLQPIQPSQAIAIWEIVAVLVGNVFSAVVGILVLVFYNDSTVKDYFARLNAPQTPPPPASPEPAATLPIESTATPVASEPADIPTWLKPEAPAGPDVPTAPVAPEAKSATKKKSPAKPKTVRKTTKK